MLKLNNVTKKFGSLTAVSGLSLEVKRSEIFGLIGPNGSGKTTTIKMIAGLLAPSKGEILVDGASIAESPQDAKSKIGYIPDDPNVWEKLTGEEFLNFVGAIFALQAKEIARRAKELLAIYQIENLAGGYFGDYSRGTKQKFTIIAALIHQPKLLLIDEPMVGLDPQSAKTTGKLLVEFAKGGGAVLLATHTLPIAQKICTHLGILDGGKLKVSGNLATLRKKAKLQEGELEELYFRLLK